MREDEELIEQARQSREETKELREEGRQSDDDEHEPPEPSGGEPWAKTSSGDAEHLTDDDDD